MGPTKKYNIVFIITDEERMPVDMPASVELPAHKWMAEQGVSFHQHHVSTAPCTPSRSSIFTGQHVPHTKMVDNINFGYVPDMNPSIPTLGTMLSAAGYSTAYLGKWHLTNFDTHTCQGPPTTESMKPYGFAEYNECGDVHGAPRAGHMNDEDIADDAIGWLTDRAASGSADPFFLVVGFVNPHDIMFVDTDGIGPMGKTQKAGGTVPVVPAPAVAPYNQDHDPPLPTSLHDSFDDRPQAHEEFAKAISFSFGDIPLDRDDMWKNYLNYYINCQIEVDTRIQKLLDALASSGLDKDTIVVFTSDHGDMGGAHRGLRQKGPFIYRENVNVPLIVVHPDGSKGQTTAALTSGVDFAPTLLAFAGVSQAERAKLYPELKGKDFSPQLFDQKSPGPRDETGVLMTYECLTTIDSTYAVETMGAGWGEDPCDSNKQPDFNMKGLMRGVFDGRYKFNRYFAPNNYNRPADFDALVAHNDLELYDTQTDPEERDNLAAASAIDANKALVETMRAKLEAVIDLEIGADDAFPLGKLDICNMP